MSVVVWRGDMLAADQQVSNSGVKQRTCKIEEFNGEALATTGDYSNGKILIEWYKSGALPHDFPKFDSNTYADRLIVLTPTGLRVYEGPHPITSYLDGYAAFGSGMEAALGALYVGADAVQAVRAALHHSEGCGYGVNVIKIPQVQ
jgi:hypothetical protein